MIGRLLDEFGEDCFLKCVSAVPIRGESILPSADNDDELFSVRGADRMKQQQVLLLEECRAVMWKSFLEMAGEDNQDDGGDLCRIIAGHIEERGREKARYRGDSVELEIKVIKKSPDLEEDSSAFIHGDALLVGRKKLVLLVHAEGLYDEEDDWEDMHESESMKIDESDQNDMDVLVLDVVALRSAGLAGEVPDDVVNLGSLLSLRRSFDAIQYFRELDKTNPQRSKMHPIVRCIFGVPPVFDKTYDKRSLRGEEFLDQSQANVLHSFSSMQTGAMICQGPPGTGKTSMLVRLIWRLCRRKEGAVFVCAPSNKAVQELLERFMKNHPEEKVLLFGNHRRVPQHLRRVHFSSLSKKRFAREVQRDLLEESSVFFSTLSTADRVRRILVRVGKGVSIGSLIVDEAGQATEAEVYIPLVIPGIPKMLLVGDPKQLPPTVISEDAALKGMGTSLMERLMFRDKFPFCFVLQVQYRMPPPLYSWPNSAFYQGAVKNSPRVSRIAPPLAPLFEGYRAGLQVKSSPARVGTSWKNEGEAKVIKNLVSQIRSVDEGFSIGIVTFYAAQVEELKKTLKKDERILISTVDGFQGGEVDVMVFSCVRSKPSRFMENFNRVNVAVTRAKKFLFLVGDLNGLASHNAMLRSLISQFHPFVEGTKVSSVLEEMEWKRGDWHCSSCFQHRYSFQRKCKKCDRNEQERSGVTKRFLGDLLMDLPEIGNRKLTKEELQRESKRWKTVAERLKSEGTKSNIVWATLLDFAREKKLPKMFLQRSKQYIVGYKI